VATSARLLTQLCTCGAGATNCVCTTLPFGDGDGSVKASHETDLDRARVGTGTEPTSHDKAKLAALLQAMRKAGVAPPYGGKRLSAAELASMLAAQETTAGKINVKLLCRDAEIMPAGTR
jgi:hypothetical protein